MAVAKKPEKTYPAFTLMRIKDGWSFVELKCDEDFNTVSYTVTEPDMKAIAQEAFKIAVGKYWLKLEN